MNSLTSNKNRKRDVFEVENNMKQVEYESDEELTSFPGLDALNLDWTPPTTDNEKNKSDNEDS